MSGVRPVRPDEIHAVARTLARAFDDDPVMAWLLGDADTARRRKLVRFMRAEARRHARRDDALALTRDGRPGAALWSAPGGWRTPWRDMLREAPGLVTAMGPRLPRALRGLAVMERQHPREPHWYLAILGTDPAHQGTGVGTMLVTPVLERCDASGLGAYLESSKPGNVPYYERFGFRVTGELAMPGGPPLWPMWRDPR